MHNPAAIAPAWWKGDAGRRAGAGESRPGKTLWIVREKIHLKRE